MKKIIHIILLFFSFTLSAQSERDASVALKTISSLDQVDSLKQAQPDWYINITKTLPVGFSYDSLLFNTNEGEIIQVQHSEKRPKYLHKVIKKGQEEVCKVIYIYLNGREHKLSEIKKLQEQIIKQYKDGAAFQDLVQKYTEDGNPTGELDWFSKGVMVDDFDQQVRGRSAGEIFTVDVEKNNWYYVVLKTEENKTLECTYSVRIKLSR
jgi:hypothetical protein